MATPEEINSLPTIERMEWSFQHTMTMYEKFLAGKIYTHELPALREVGEKVRQLNLFMQNIINGHRG